MLAVSCRLTDRLPEILESMCKSFMLDPNEVFGGPRTTPALSPEAGSQEHFVPYTMLGLAEDPTRRHIFERYEHSCSCLRSGAQERGDRDARSHRRQMDSDGGRHPASRADALQPDSTRGRRDFTTHAHSDLEGSGGGRARQPHDVSDHSAARGLRADRPRAGVDRAASITLRMGSGASAGDTGRAREIRKAAAKG